MICEKIEARKQELFQTLSELIQIDSQSFGAQGNEKQIAIFIGEKLREMGYEPDLYTPLDIPGMTEHPDYWPEHDLAERYNVSAVIPGADHSRRIMLAAHNDTVAVGDQKNWTVDPFGGEIKDGKIWGRGACDDKYGIAAVLFLLRLFRDEGLQLPCDLVFTAYCNEEYGGSHGALAACLRYPCDDVINLDCKNFEIWSCAVGGEELKAHICTTQPVDDCGILLEGLALLKSEFLRFRQRRYEELMAHPEYACTSIPDSSVRFLELRAGNSGTDLNRAHAEVCYYAAADKPQIDREFAEMAQRLNTQLTPLGMTFSHFEKLCRFFHFGKSEKENPLMDKLIAAGKRASGRELKPCGSCQSDLSIFLKYGSPRAFSFGIGRDFGAYGGAHQADEYIECDRFLEFTMILGELLSADLADGFVIAKEN